jgi:hypothetical protein
MKILLFSWLRRCLLVTVPQLTHDGNWPIQSYFTTGGLPPISSPYRQAPRGSQPEIFFSQLYPYGPSPNVTSSLTRIWVCSLELLLVLASAVILRYGSHGTHDHILVSDLRLPKPGGPGPRIYISQEQGGPVITPGTGFPFRRLLRLAGLRWRYSTPPPHGTQLAKLPLRFSLYSLGTDGKVNAVSHSSFIVACVSVAADTCLSAVTECGQFLLAPLSSFQMSCHNMTANLMLGGMIKNSTGGDGWGLSVGNYDSQFSVRRVSSKYHVIYDDTNPELWI